MLWPLGHPNLLLDESLTPQPTTPYSTTLTAPPLPLSLQPVDAVHPVLVTAVGLRQKGEASAALERVRAAIQGSLSSQETLVELQVRPWRLAVGGWHVAQCGR